MEQIIRSSTPDGMAPLSNLGILIFISVICLMSLAWGIFNGVLLIQYDSEQEYSGGVDSSKIVQIGDMSNKIMQSLLMYFKYNFPLCLFVVIIFFIIIMGAIQNFQGFTTSISYLIGAINSILLSIFIGFIGELSHMRVASACRQSVSKAYAISKLAANCQTFISLGWTIIMLPLFIALYQRTVGDIQDHDVEKVCQALIGFSFGSATVLTISRITSVTYSKGVQSSLIWMRTIDNRLKRDNKNPIIVAKVVGEVLTKQICNNLAMTTIVSTLIALGSAAAGKNIIGTDQQGQIIFNLAINNIYLPSLGVAYCLFFGLVANIGLNALIFVDDSPRLRLNMLAQMGSVFIMHIGFMALASYLCLPAQFQINQMGTDVKHPYYAYICILLGMASGSIIMMCSQLATNSPYFVDNILQNSNSGAATGIISGLSFGYMFNVLPTIIIVGMAFVGSYWLGVYGVCLIALGYGSLFPIYSFINNFYSITENTTFIVYICKMSEGTILASLALSQNRKKFQPHLQTFFNGILILVSYAIARLFIIYSGLKLQVLMNDYCIFTGLIVGAASPYFFSGMMIKAIHSISRIICDDVKQQIEQMPGILQGTVESDILRTTQIQAFYSVLSIKYFIISLFFSFAVVGIGLGPKQTAGFTIGIIISGAQLAISSGISGSIWGVVCDEVRAGRAKDDEENPIKPESQWAKACEVATQISPSFKDALSMGIPTFILYVGLLNLVMGKLYVSIIHQ